jgi:hypothetical protein
LKARARRNGRFHLTIFNEPEPANQGRHQQQHHNHSFRHTFSGQELQTWLLIQAKTGAHQQYFTY